MRILDSYGDCADRINKALSFALQHGRIEGDREKGWVIDQIIRELAGNEYDRVISGLDSDSAKGFGSVLNFIPVGERGYVIELCLTEEDSEIRWRWSLRLGTSVQKSISQSYSSTREDALMEALDWWRKNSSSYWN